VSSLSSHKGIECIQLSVPATGAGLSFFLALFQTTIMPRLKEMMVRFKANTVDSNRFTSFSLPRSVTPPQFPEPILHGLQALEFCFEGVSHIHGAQDFLRVFKSAQDRGILHITPASVVLEPGGVSARYLTDQINRWGLA
jgi:hypothetical protein